MLGCILKIVEFPVPLFLQRWANNIIRRHSDSHQRCDILYEAGFYKLISEIGDLIEKATYATKVRQDSWIIQRYGFNGGRSLDTTNVLNVAYRTPYAVVLMLWMVAGRWCCRAAPIQAVWSLKVKGWSSRQKLLWMMAQLVAFSSSCSKASRLRDSATWCLAVVPEGGATSLNSVVCNGYVFRLWRLRIG